MTNKTKVCIVDDHKLIRDGIRLILNETKQFELSNEFGNPLKFYKVLNETTTNWDILILDITLQKTCGLNLIHPIKCRRPHMPILMLTMHNESQFFTQAMTNGADGYMTKDNASTDLIYALTHILSGKKYFCDSFSDAVCLNHYDSSPTPKHHALSKQEFNVFLGLGNGETPTSIAHQLSLSVKTVSTYRSRILSKLNFTSNADIIRYCLEEKLIF
jgi:DNA-binding NarL/FixJ family response regulator